MEWTWVAISVIFFSISYIGKQISGLSSSYDKISKLENEIDLLKEEVNFLKKENLFLLDETMHFLMPNQWELINDDKQSEFVPKVIESLDSAAQVEYMLYKYSIYSILEKREKNILKSDN